MKNVILSTLVIMMTTLGIAQAGVCVDLHDRKGKAKLNNIINSQLILFKTNLEQYQFMSRKAKALKKQLDEYIDEQE